VTPSTTATYASINTAGNTLTFSFVVPAANQNLSIATQSLVAGTIVDQTGAAAAERLITAAHGTSAGVKRTV
jgi:hypothetical protein